VEDSAAERYVGAVTDRLAGNARSLISSIAPSPISCSAVTLIFYLLTHLRGLINK